MKHSKKELAIIAAISIGIPLLISWLMNSNGNDTPDVVEENSTNMVEVLNFQPTVVEPQSIFWMGSPVSQKWVFNEKKQAWETLLPYKESFKSPPTYVIGLRDDGVVIWKRSDELWEKE